MLQVSESAVSVLREARTEQEIPESYGLRVFPHQDETGQTGLALTFTEAPVDGDQVTEQSGTEVYVAPELVEPLADQVLDVEETPQGTALTLVPQQS